MSAHFYPLSVCSIHPETPDCVVVEFAVPTHLQSTFAFVQGQNITLRAEVNGEDLRRSYSICTAPHQGQLKVAVKKIPGGRFSTYVNEYLKTGDVLQVMPPTGRFNTKLHSDHQKNYVAFAAGSGITPILSIISSILHEERHSRITLVYGNRNRASIIFFETIAALKNKYLNRFHCIHLLSREEADSPVNNGRIDAQKLDQLSTLIQYQQVDDYFLCGPEEMIFTVKSYLEQQSVSPEKIHFELFSSPGQSPALQQTNQLASDSAAISTITIVSDGRRFQFPLPFAGASILDAALKQGADLPFACKGGVCCTCKAKLLDGTVEMKVNYALEKEEVEQGYILTCQSHPTSESVLVDFDIK